MPCIEVAGQAQGAADVLGEDTGVQPKRGAVGRSQGFFVIVHHLNGQHRAKNFFLHAGVGVGQVIQNGGAVKPAGVQWVVGARMATHRNGGTTCPSRIDVPCNFCQLLPGVDRAHIEVAQTVAHPEQASFVHQRLQQGAVDTALHH